jgi:Zn finger protein HypA/HybF involved in hydrogenase expression
MIQMYNRCKCEKCGSEFATVLKNDLELQNEPCPKCGEKLLKITGPLSFYETSRLFSGGG